MIFFDWKKIVDGSVALLKDKTVFKKMLEYVCDNSNSWNFCRLVFLDVYFLCGVFGCHFLFCDGDFFLWTLGKPMLAFL